MHIWDEINLKATLLELSLGSVWDRNTLTGVHIWDEINLKAPLFGLTFSSVWEREKR